MIRIDHLIVMLPRERHKRNEQTLVTVHPTVERQDAVKRINQSLVEGLFNYLNSKCLESEHGSAKLNIKSVTCAIAMSEFQRQIFERFILQFSTCAKDHIFYNMTPDIDRYWECAQKRSTHTATGDFACCTIPSPMFERCNFCVCANLG